MEDLIKEITRIDNLIQDLRKIISDTKCEPTSKNRELVLANEKLREAQFWIDVYLGKLSEQKDKLEESLSWEYTTVNVWQYERHSVFEKMKWNGWEYYKEEDSGWPRTPDYVTFRRKKQNKQD